VRRLRMNVTMDIEKRLATRIKSLSDAMNQLEDLRDAHEFLTRKGSPIATGVEVRNKILKVPTEAVAKVLGEYIENLEAWLHTQPEYTAMISF
jgi:hypothetical protein